MNDAIATHEPPAEADHVVQVNLERHGMPGRTEQLWVQAVGARRFVVRSIPFFVLGVGPGDEILLGRGGHVLECDRGGSRHVHRIAFDPDIADDAHESLHRLLVGLDLDHEWHGSGFVALSLGDHVLPVAVRAFLEPYTSDGTAFTELATA